MNRKTKTFLTAFIVLSVLGLVILVLVHDRFKSNVKVTITEDRDIEVSIEEVHYSGSKEGRLEWELDADAARRSTKAGLTELDTVKFVYYARDGKTYTLTAPKASYNENEEVISASGGVTIESLEGYRLTAERVEYSIKTREMTSKDPVTIKSKGMDVTGVGLLAEFGTGTLVLLSDVEAVLRQTAI